jgi:hypothetical protein
MIFFFKFSDFLERNLGGGGYGTFEHAGIASTLLTFNRETVGSNLCQDTEYPNNGLVFFLSPPS